MTPTINLLNLCLVYDETAYTFRVKTSFKCHKIIIIFLKVKSKILNLYRNLIHRGTKTLDYNNLERFG